MKSAESIGEIQKKLPMLFLFGKDDPVGEMGKGAERLMNAYKAAEIKDVSLNFSPGRHDSLREAFLFVIPQKRIFMFEVPKTVSL